ncbi:MAG: hypothetical protein HYY05_08445 [Chloroflexi bacterium]|nr:hypothetical protein [Chloroflexota bacterium]
MKRLAVWLLAGIVAIGLVAGPAAPAFAAGQGCDRVNQAGPNGFDGGADGFDGGADGFDGGADGFDGGADGRSRAAGQACR